jgi:hypothetical protein
VAIAFARRLAKLDVVPEVVVLRAHRSSSVFPVVAIRLPIYSPPFPEVSAV